MTLSLSIHPEAESELLEAAQWYEQERPYLGDAFISEVRSAERRVLDWPESAPVLPDWEGSPPVRSANVRVFPYRVIYRVAGNIVEILAYAHARRRPNHWQQRLIG